MIGRLGISIDYEACKPLSVSFGAPVVLDLYVEVLATLRPKELVAPVIGANV